MDRDLKHQFGCFLAQILSENLFLSNAAGRKNKQGWEYLVSLWGESSKSKCSSCCRICPIDPKADASLMTATGVVMPPILLLLVSVQTLKENLYGKRSYLCSKQHLKTWTRILCMCQFGCLILLVLLCQWRKIINTVSHLSWIAERFCSTGSQKEREREEKLESQCYRSIKWLLSAVITAIDITSRQTFPPATRRSRLLSIHLTVRCSCIDIGGVFPVWKSN